MLPLQYRREALTDIDAAYAWYEGQQTGLGEEFLTTVREYLDLIRQQPQAFAARYRQVRAIPMRRFPYVVYYRVDADRILIMAVQHGGRHPRGWRSRA